MTLDANVRGFWFDIEGIDGCGKGEIIGRLGELFRKDSRFKKHSIVLTKEPTYITKAGSEIREILRTEEDPQISGQKLLELFFQDRREHQENLIIPARNFGAIVINDRGELSSFAYQQVQLGGESFERIFELSRTVKRPNLYLIVDTPAKEAMKRMQIDGGGREKFERDIEFLEAVRQNFLELPSSLPCPPYNIKIINGNRPKEEVYIEAKQIVLAAYRNVAE